MRNIVLNGVLFLCLLPNFLSASPFESQLKKIEYFIEYECFEEAWDTLQTLPESELKKESYYKYIYLKGEILLYSDFLNEAFYAYEKLYKAEFNRFTYSAISRLAYLFYLSADYEKSLDFINEIPIEKRTYTDQLVISRAYSELKNYDAAHGIYDQLISENNSDYNYFQKANCFMKEDRFVDALKIYLNLINNNQEPEMLYFNNLIYCLNKIDVQQATKYIDFVDLFIDENRKISSHRLGVYYQNKAEYLSKMNCHKNSIKYIDLAISTYFNVDEVEEINLNNLRDKESLLDFYDEKIEILLRAESSQLRSTFYFIHDLITQLKFESVEDEIKFRKGKDYSKYYIKAFHYFKGKNDIETAYFFLSQIKDSNLKQDISIRNNEVYKASAVDALYNEQYELTLDSAAKNEIRLNAYRSFTNESNKIIYSDQYNLSEFQKTLSSKDLVLDYYIVDTKIYLFKITSKTIELYDLDLELESINSLKDFVLGKPKMEDWNIVRYSALFEALDKLESRLIPFEIELYYNLIIIPHEELHGFSFEVLRRDNRYLVEDKIISYASSTYLLNNVNYGIYKNGNNYLVNHLETEYLKGSSKEKEQLNYHFNLANCSIESLVKGDYNSANIIHFSNHAQIENDRLNTFFQVDKTSKLTIREILQGDLKANLIVFAGCETGVGERVEAEGVYGLSRSAFITGSKAVISSLHKINDDSSQEIIEYFYDHLNKGYSASEALTFAKRKFLKTQNSFYQHPYFWTGLVLEGNYKIRPLKKKFQFLSLLID